MGHMLLTTLLTLYSKPEGTSFSLVKCRHFQLQITTCAQNGKIQLTPKITNHLFTYYLNCKCKSNPVCLSQQWSVIFLLASYAQWHYFLVWAYENQPIDFSPSMFTLKGYSVQCHTSSNEWIHFVLRSRQICLRTNSYADPNQHYNTNLNSHMHPSVHQVWV